MIDLMGKMCRGVDLRSYDFRGAELSYATFIDCDFSGVNLRGAKVTQTNFSGSNFSGSNLIMLKHGFGVHFDRTNLCGAEFYKADCNYGSFCAADLSGANLRGADFYKANFDTANLSGADFRGVHLRKAYLSKVDLSNAVDLTEQQLLEVTKLYGVRGLDLAVLDSLKAKKPELFEKPPSLLDKSNSVK